MFPFQLIYMVAVSQGKISGADPMFICEMHLINSFNIGKSWEKISKCIALNALVIAECAVKNTRNQ